MDVPGRHGARRPDRLRPRVSSGERRQRRSFKGGRMKKKNTTRREFVGDVAKASAGAALSTFTIVPRHVLGGPGFTPPSALLNIGIVGMGGMGSGNAEALSGENLVAFCDVDPANMERGVMGDGRETRAPSPERALLREKYQKATKYVDFR